MPEHPPDPPTRERERERAGGLTSERERKIRNRAEVGMKLDPENDVVGQDYAALLAEIDRLRAAPPEAPPIAPKEAELGAVHECPSCKRIITKNWVELFSLCGDCLEPAQPDGPVDARGAPDFEKHSGVGGSAGGQSPPSPRRSGATSNFQEQAWAIASENCDGLHLEPVVNAIAAALRAAYTAGVPAQQPVAWRVVCVGGVPHKDFGAVYDCEEMGAEEYCRGWAAQYDAHPPWPCGPHRVEPLGVLLSQKAPSPEKCRHCGTNGDHYCPADVSGGEGADA